MPRPRMKRRVWFLPSTDYFSPNNPSSDEENVLTPEELEALRLKDYLGLDQKEAAERMGVSQPTFHRILKDARRKVAKSLVRSEHLRFGNIPSDNGQRLLQCLDCGFNWGEPYGTGRPSACPNCGSPHIVRVDKGKGRGRRGLRGMF